MTTTAIIELEEGALSITTATVHGRTVQATRSVHVPLPDLEHSTLVSILTSLSADMLRSVRDVHLVLGDRRMHHFRCDVPRMPAAALEDFVQREAMRMTGLPTVADVMVAVAGVHKGPNGTLRIAATALPRAVWDSLRRTFDESGVKVTSLRSLESCLALMAPSTASTAVVECGVGRTRFVLSENRTVCQVRRFIVGSSANGSSEAIGAQLTLELPRTLEWLRESGNTAPVCMLLGPRAAAGIRAIGMDMDGLPPVIERRDALADAGQGESPIACSTLLAALANNSAPASLLEPLRLALPLTGRRVAALAVAAAIAAIGAWSFCGDLARWRLASTRIAQLVTTADEVRHSLQDAQAAGAVAFDSTSHEQARLQQALGRRRPVSLLIADLARACGKVHLDAVDSGGDDRVGVSGFVTAASRREALEEISRFLREVRALPYLLPTALEDIGELPGLLPGFRFQVGFTWRTS